jgi:parvulin-like peptidyl-prolyl isomerase
VLLGAILLRPGTAQEILNLARQVRGQAPDPASNQGYVPTIDPRVSRQFESIPQGPTQPMPLRYPAPSNESGGPRQSPNGGGVTGAPAAPPGIAPIQQLDSAVIVARVGSDAILASDLFGRYAYYAAAQSQGAPESALAAMRKELLDDIRNLADSKLLFAEASKKIPPEGLKDIEKKMGEEFDENQLKAMMQRANCQTKEQLEAKLREAGTSLPRRRQFFFEQSLAQHWLYEQIKGKDEEIPLADILAYYKANGPKFDHEGTALWEELTVLFSRVPDKNSARATIVRMGNDVLSGRPFAEVAKAGSQGLTAANGGLRDWTTKGSLKSAIMDEAIFNLPVMRMSQILEDDDGVHIVRVIQRKDAYRTPFKDAQVEIRKQLKEEQFNRKKEDYLSKLRQQNPIWTIFDGEGAVDSGVASVAARPSRP